MQWTHIITDPAVVLPGGQASVDLLQNARTVAPDAIGRGNTIKRILGDVWIRPGAAGSETEGVMGITKTEADAEAASATADPAFNTLARWLYWKRFIVGTEATDELGIGALRQFNMDLKMNVQIFNRADALNLILDNDDGTHAFIFALGLRILIAK